MNSPFRAFSLKINRLLPRVSFFGNEWYAGRRNYPVGPLWAIFRNKWWLPHVICFPEESRLFMTGFSALCRMHGKRLPIIMRRLMRLYLFCCLSGLPGFQSSKIPNLSSEEAKKVPKFFLRLRRLYAYYKPALCYKITLKLSPFIFLIHSTCILTLKASRACSKF